MGGFTPVSNLFSALSMAESGVGDILNPINRVSALGQTVGLFDSDNDKQRKDVRAQNELALKQLQAQQNLQEQQLAQQNALESQRIAEQSRAAAEERQAALRRAVARQRAQFGASGVSSGSGSSQAVLLGLFDETEEERERRERLDKLRNAALDQKSNQLKSSNILTATQAAQKNQLKIITS